METGSLRWCSWRRLPGQVSKAAGGKRRQRTMIAVVSMRLEDEWRKRGLVREISLKCQGQRRWGEKRRGGAAAFIAFIAPGGVKAAASDGCTWRLLRRTSKPVYRPSPPLTAWGLHLGREVRSSDGGKAPVTDLLWRKNGENFRLAFQAKHVHVSVPRTCGVRRKGNQGPTVHQFPRSPPVRRRRPRSE